LEGPPRASWQNADKWWSDVAERLCSGRTSSHRDRLVTKVAREKHRQPSIHGAAITVDAQNDGSESGVFYLRRRPRGAWAGTRSDGRAGECLIRSVAGRQICLLSPPTDMQKLVNLQTGQRSDFFRMFRRKMAFFRAYRFRGCVTRWKKMAVPLPPALIYSRPALRIARVPRVGLGIDRSKR